MWRRQGPKVRRKLRHKVQEQEPLQGPLHREVEQVQEVEVQGERREQILQEQTHQQRMEEHLLDVDWQTREAIVIPRLGGQDREVAGRRRPFVRQGEGERMDLAPFLEPVIPQAVAGVRLIA